MHCESLPRCHNPCIAIMSSYQETTLSNQSVKARDMLTCFQKIQEYKINYHRNVTFINFADGGGWLGRRSDLRKLY
jgi:hypothetical protein